MDTRNSILWRPDERYIEDSIMYRFSQYITEKTGKNLMEYSKLWEWSVNNIDNFWAFLAEFFDINIGKYDYTLRGENVNATWFAGSRLNYANYVYRNRNLNKIAVIGYNEYGEELRITYSELWRRVSSLAYYFLEHGIGAGDRICAYIGNTPEAVISFLASASIGAIWSSCSPDFGVKGVIERFTQIDPSVFIVSPEYSYNGKKYERGENSSEILKALPGVKLAISTGNKEISGFINMGDVPDNSREFVPVPVDFSHPLWILYSSGTTGKPKAIVHGHGGIVLEHFKVLGLHMNISRDSIFTWATTTGWMMWNVLASGLLMGSTIVMYDGSLNYPDISILWKIADRFKITHLGVSAAYIESVMKQGYFPGEKHQLEKLEFIGSTGSPLSEEAFDFVYAHIKNRVWLSSLSGGTDLCSAICLGSPTLPVYSGMIQCRGLGAMVESLDENGNPLLCRKGELAIMKPMPNMPVFFWNDPGKKRYYESYYSFFPGVWRHGDFISIHKNGNIVIYGRSDAVLNRNGIRIGTGEIYSALESTECIRNSIVIGYRNRKNVYRIALFVQLKDNMKMDKKLEEKIRRQIREDLSPRHVPDIIMAVPEIPETLNGKKIEVPLTRIIEGESPNTVINRESLKNPASLDYFVQIRKSLV
ncbi:MAG: acetoacetate--CoA ligase [Ferroplasma sp.]|uniref:acetoacetate--CoA ligase n=1 Tax=Ferroplasma sp. TaxID=2591003 RepID=UPI002814F397|nr:acetoacetate--CoA ligase [Ferroplasma sp.]WMT50450.1 MAG: acetoacetate--CoA ligase [Ferroplasma sp.]